MHPDELLILDREAVLDCLAALDPVRVVEDVVRAHARGQISLPAEGYMAWQNSSEAYTRSLAMLGGLSRPGRSSVYGLKLINASVSNPARGIERAGGLSFLFDPDTARPRVMLEAGYLSGLRTAAYTVLSLEQLGPSDWDSFSLLGCGTIARRHAELIPRYFSSATTAVVYDVVPERAEQLRSWAERTIEDLDVVVAPTAEACVRSTPVLVTATVSTTPYIPAHWLEPGTFVAHVSLDDLSEDALRAAAAIYVDDVNLVRDNPRRVLGRLVADGLAIAGTLGELLEGLVPAQRPTADVIVSNPFGMAILDVGLADEVAREAAAAGIGTTIDLMGGIRVEPAR